MQRLAVATMMANMTRLENVHADKDVEPARALLALGTGRALAPEG